MLLTCAAIDRRHPSARQALGDCCDMHRNVMRLFAPEDNMRAEACVLFRVLEERGTARLYLTSATPPDLSRAAWLFYGRDARQRDLSPLLERFRPGIVFGFDLLAYPCKKVDVGRANSVRAFLTTPEERRAWLLRQGEKNGFALRALREDEPADMRGKRRTGLVQIRAVRFSGVLEITDAERFRDGYLRGVGPEKAYGLGMLMLRKV